MPGASENPCAGCEIDTDCCRRLADLRLSPAEYERHFAACHDAIEARRCPDAWIVSAPNACLHLRGTQCEVYETRPVECRLFPHTTGGMKRIGRLAIVTYHHRTRCPRKRRLLAPRRKVAALLTELARDTYGPDVRVLAVPDILPVRLMRILSRVPRKIRKIISGR